MTIFLEKLIFLGKFFFFQIHKLCIFLIFFLIFFDGFFCRDQLTKDDIKVYGAILEQPSSDLYPNASKWYQAVSAKLASRYILSFYSIFVLFILFLIVFAVKVGFFSVFV